jgi:fatty-acid desaturase
MPRATQRDPIYHRRRFPVEVIEQCVRWYLTYRLSYRDLVAMMAERGVTVSHTTILRWVLRYIPEYEKRWARYAQPVNSSVRVAVSVTSHWVVTYFAHNPGPGRWMVLGAGVQASNLPGWGFLTHGECWHNNHHAFPESARLGVDQGQLDPGWIALRLLEQCGLASNLVGITDLH